MAGQAVKASFIGAPGPSAIASLFLALLLVGDLVYVVIHLVNAKTNLLESPLAALDMDRGYAEFFQYMKLLWTVLLLICFFLRTRSAGFLAWALLFAYLLVDDSFSLHENFGSILAERLAFDDAMSLRAVDFGELLVSATAGAVLAVGIAWAYILEPDKRFRKSSQHLLALLLVMVFFGVVVDMVHYALSSVYWLDKALLILEDGGEMVAMSFITWYAFLLLVAGDRIGNASLGSLILQLPARRWGER